MRHDFESGAWAELRPASDLKGRDKRTLDVVQYQGYDLDADGDLDPVATGRRLGSRGRRALYLGNIRGGTIALVVTGWSFSQPVPVISEDQQLSGHEVLDELGLDDLNELEGLMLPYTQKLTREPDPKAPAAATTTSSAGPSPAVVPSPTG